MKIAATFLDWLPFFPVTRGQLIMMQEGNTADPKTLTELIGRELKNFNPETLKYLNN